MAVEPVAGLPPPSRDSVGVGFAGGTLVSVIVGGTVAVTVGRTPVAVAVGGAISEAVAVGAIVAVSVAVGGAISEAVAVGAIVAVSVSVGSGHAFVEGVVMPNTAIATTATSKTLKNTLKAFISPPYKG